MPRVACLGTRSPHHLPRAWVDLYVSAVRQFAREGAVIHSTAMPGSDRMAAEYALRAGASVRIYLPWDAYEQAWVDKMETGFPGQVDRARYDAESRHEWEEVVHAWHPTARYLAPAMMKSYARTFGSVLEADSVLALPMARRGKGEVDKGSAEQAIWLAQQREVPLFDLSEEGDRNRLVRQLEQSAPTG